MKKLLFCLIITLVFYSCNNTTGKVDAVNAAADTTIDVKYAKGFKVSEYNGYRLVDIQEIGRAHV